MDISKSMKMENKLGAPWPAPPPWTAFSQGHYTLWYTARLSTVHNEQPQRQRDNAAIGISRGKQEQPTKGNSQLCPQGYRGLRSPLLCPRLCCGHGYISPSATEGVLQAMATKLSSRESVGSSWCSPVMAEPSEGTGAPQEPPPVNPLPN